MKLDSSILLELFETAVALIRVLATQRILWLGQAGGSETGSFRVLSYPRTGRSNGRSQRGEGSRGYRQINFQDGEKREENPITAS